MQPKGSAVLVNLSLCLLAQGCSTDGRDNSRCTWLLLKLTVLLIRHSPAGQRFYGPWNKVSLWGHFLFMWNNRVSKHSEQHRILIHGLNSCGLLLDVEWKWPANAPICQQVLAYHPAGHSEPSSQGQGVNHQVNCGQSRMAKFTWFRHRWNIDHLCIDKLY